MSHSALFVPRLPSAFHASLEDGTRALFRPLRPSDAPRIAEGYRQLSPLGRRRRFQEPPAELSPEQLQALTRPDEQSFDAWGAANLDQPDEPGIGLARYLHLPGEEAAAEVAITIADAYQRKGAAVLLHACLHLSAHRRGYQQFFYQVVPDNERFAHQLKDLGAELVGRDGQLTRLRLPVYARPGKVPHHTLGGQRLVRAMRMIGAARPVHD